MPMTNPFTADVFSMAAMIYAVNKFPNLYDRTLSIFRPSGITTTTLLVEQRNGTLDIVRTRPRGAPADKVQSDKRALRSFIIPHLIISDVLLPDDYQNVRQFGSDNALEGQASVMGIKLEKMKNILDQTREHLRVGALKGIILDADGSTLYNLYTEFGIVAKTVSFALADDETDVRAKCLEVKRHIETNLLGASMSAVRCLVDGTFYDALTSHPNVKAAFAQYQALNQNLAEDYRKNFKFGDIYWEEYPATWTDINGVARLAIASGEGHCFPEGTGNVFEEVFAPGNFIETVNTIGQPYYVRQELKPMGQGIDLLAESNPLPICKRPEVLVKVTAA